MPERPTASRLAQAPAHPPHFDGRRFLNPGMPFDKGLAEVLKWQLTRTRTPWPARVANTATPRLLERGSPGPSAQLAATWVGHATFVLQFSGADDVFTVVTDPFFSERASPVPFAGPRRVRDPGVRIDALPKVDAVVVSHNHYDHLDLPSLRALEARFSPKFVVPLGNAGILRRAGLKDVVELDWWGSKALGGPLDVHITLAPALHWSARGSGDRFDSLWGSFLIAAAGRTAYFAGDTGYHTHFADVRARLGAPDLALLPIGAYEPRWFMEFQHMNPDDAVMAHVDLGARTSLAMHHSTLCLTDEGIDEPKRALTLALETRGVGGFEVVEVGETWGGRG